MNRKKKLLPVLLTLTLIFASCIINIYAHGETDPVTQGSENQVPANVVTSVPGTPTSSPQTSAPPQSKAPSSSRKVPSRAPSRAKRRVKKASVQSSSSSVSSGASSVSSQISQQAESSISLPSVGSLPEDNFPSSLAGNSEAANHTSWIGIISWACIVLGVLVIVIVLLSNRRPPHGPGRKRYHRPKRRKKHLLNDKYYRNINRY